MSSSGTVTHTTGMEITQKSFIWEIKNFHVIIKEDNMINSQKLFFEAKEGSGLQSKWVVFLQAQEKEGKKWVGIFYDLDPQQPTVLINDYLYSRVYFASKNKEGKTTWSGDAQNSNVNLMSTGLGFSRMIDVAEFSGTGSLDIHITFKLYSPAKPTRGSRVETGTAAKEFIMRCEMQSKARNDTGKLLHNPLTGEMTIRSRDKKEFTIPRRILAVRSPVFEAMMGSDMVEAKTGVMELPDMSGKSLEVLLGYIYTGELHKDWKESGVIYELTNAAAKFQLLDLLQYLDLTLGKVCDLGNALPLFILANQLQLKTAEQELLVFIREKGASSVESLCTILKTVGST